MRRSGELALALAALAAVSAAAQPAEAFPQREWRSRVEAAKRYADLRAGLISFALVDEAGRVHGYRSRAVVPTASLLKPLLLVAYLRLGTVRARPLTHIERSLLGPMIRRSDNAAVATVFPLVGAQRLRRLARIAHMGRFRLVWPVWGLSETTARNQARFFYRIDSYVPSRHRAYALRLLRTIVPSQRWGVGQIARPGWRLYFKGGWGSGTGFVDHQSALLTSRRSRVALGITTRLNPNHEYAKQTLRGIAGRLAGRLRRPLASGSLRPF